MVLKKLFMLSSWLCSLFKHNRTRPEILTELPHQGYCALNALRWPSSACRLTATGWSHGSSLTFRRPCALTSEQLEFHRPDEHRSASPQSQREACPHCLGQQKDNRVHHPTETWGPWGSSLVWGLLLEGCYQYVEGSRNGWRESLSSEEP